MGSCNAEGDGFHLHQLRLGSGGATHKQNTGWKQVGIQEENQGRRIDWAIQSAVSCSVFPRTKVWTTTKPSVQSSDSNRFVPWLQLQFRNVSSLISWTSLQRFLMDTWRRRCSWSNRKVLWWKEKNTWSASWNRKMKQSLYAISQVLELYAGRAPEGYGICSIYQWSVHLHSGWRRNNYHRSLCWRLERAQKESSKWKLRCPRS